MSLDDLHHDHANAVLKCECELDELNDQIAAVLGERAELCVAFGHSVDVDVPIPFIFEIDMHTRARLPDGEIYLAIRGEAFDRRYRLDVHVRLPDERMKMVDRPGTEGEASLAAWRKGWEHVAHAGLELDDDEQRVALLISLAPDALAEEVEVRARRACGLSPELE